MFTSSRAASATVAWLWSASSCSSGRASSRTSRPERKRWHERETPMPTHILFRGEVFEVAQIVSV